MEILPNRVYDHYKGGKYLVLCVADDSTNNRDGNRLVVYVSLTYGVIKCRDLSEFIGETQWPDGTVRPRFALSDQALY